MKYKNCIVVAAMICAVMLFTLPFASAQERRGQQNRRGWDNKKAAHQGRGRTEQARQGECSCKDRSEAREKIRSRIKSALKKRAETGKKGEEAARKKNNSRGEGKGQRNRRATQRRDRIKPFMVERMKQRRRGAGPSEQARSGERLKELAKKHPQAAKALKERMEARKGNQELPRRARGQIRERSEADLERLVERLESLKKRLAEARAAREGKEK